MIGIIGGSGLEDPQILRDAREVEVQTPYGKHSPIRAGKIGKVEVALVSRHGYKHEYSPTAVPYRANIFALAKLECRAIVATSACGSLKEEIRPGTLSFPNQFIDRTTKREQSFTEHEKVVHESMAEPFDRELRGVLIAAAQRLKLEYTADKTVVTIEGPRFSTKAESNLFRAWNCDLINMTTVPEICLAKEKGLPYQVINLVTDYDCWRAETNAVTFEEVMKVMKNNSEKVKKLIIEALPEIQKWAEKRKK